MNQKFNNPQSNIDVINKMIATAQNNIKQGGTNELLSWGLNLSFIAILNLYCYYFTPLSYASYYLWWLVFPIWLVIWLIFKNKNKTKKIITYTDEVVNYATMCVGICIGVLSLNFTLIASFQNRYDHWQLLFPIIILLWSINLFVISISYKFKPLIYGASIACLCGCASFYVEQIFQVWFVLAAAVFGFVIPGFILNQKIKNTNCAI